MNNVSIYHFDNKALKAITQAERAVYGDNQWQLQKVEKSLINENQIQQNKEADQAWQTTITPSKLGIVSLKPESLSISGLSDYVGFLKETGQDPKRFEIAFWRKVYQPISMAVMMLLAISFVFGFYVSNITFGNMTLVFAWIPTFIGALIPSLICLTIVWWLLAKKRD